MFSEKHINANFAPNFIPGVHGALGVNEKKEAAS